MLMWPLLFMIQFIGAWGHFHHHDKVPIYFANNIYAKFVLHTRMDYTSIRSKFYGPSLGGSYGCFWVCMDLIHVAPPLRLFPQPSRSVVLLAKLVVIAAWHWDYAYHCKYHAEDIVHCTCYIAWRYEKATFIASWPTSFITWWFISR